MSRQRNAVRRMRYSAREAAPASITLSNFVEDANLKNDSKLVPDDDDTPIGRILTRREAIELLGLGGVGLLAAWKASPIGRVGIANAEAPSFAQGNVGNTGHRVNSASGGTGGNALPCVVRPEATEGPYFVDHQLNRSDIRAEPMNGKLSVGTPLMIAFNVSSVAGGTCKPVAGAIVDVWHCDAEGVYSGVDDMGFNTIGRKFLRGFQTTNADGLARFVSVYPGWYQGRTVHYHFKIRTIGSDNKGYEFTSQLFFDDALSDAVYKVAPYKRDTVRDTRNNNDMFFRDGGEQLLLTLNKGAQGYMGTFDIGLDLANAETGRSDGMGAGGPGGRGRGGPAGGPGGRGRGGPPPGARGRGGPPPDTIRAQRDDG